MEAIKAKMIEMGHPVVLTEMRDKAEGKDSSRKRGFAAGFVYAVAQMIRKGNLYDAEYLWNESNFSWEDVHHCANYDLKELINIGVGQ